MHLNSKVLRENYLITLWGIINILGLHVVRMLFNKASKLTLAMYIFLLRQDWHGKKDALISSSPKITKNVLHFKAIIA